MIKLIISMLGGVLAALAFLLGKRYGKLTERAKTQAAVIAAQAKTVKAQSDAEAIGQKITETEDALKSGAVADLDRVLSGDWPDSGNGTK